MKLPLPYNKRRWLSISFLRDVHRCLRKAAYSGGYGITPIGGPHPALDFGSAIHHAIGTWHTNFSQEETLMAFQEVWNEDRRDEKRNLMTGINLLARYMEMHKPGQGLYQLQPPPKGPQFLDLPGGLSPFEVSFAIDIGLEIPLVGKIDGIGTHRDTGETLVIEYKTASQLGSTFWDGFILNSQIITYVTVLQMAGIKCSRALVEVLQVAKTKQEIQGVFRDVTPHMSESTLKWIQFWGRLYLAAEKEFLETGENLETFGTTGFGSGCHPYEMFGMPGFKCPYILLCGVENPTNLLTGYEQKQERLSLPVLQE